MTNTFESLNEYASELGGKPNTGGINWRWYSGFPTKEAAEAFLKHPAVYEHRGIYPDEDGTFSTRVR